MSRHPVAVALGLGAVVLLGCQEGGDAVASTDDAPDAMAARAAALELPTEYFPPPGKAIDHHTAGFAKILCSNVFLTGDAVMETDPQGNFLAQGYEFVAARDWARLGNLYLQDGVWNGERILPEGWVEYATTVAPAWAEDDNPRYGGSFFWVNANREWPVPESAYGMRGAGGQSATIIPTHQLVVVRQGMFRAAAVGRQALDQAFEMLLRAVPPVE